MPDFPLVSHTSLDQTLAYRNGAPVSVRAFLADVLRLAAVLPTGAHVFNVCTDRYRFTVSLCATLLAGKISLLPSTHTPEVVRQLAAFAPDTFCLHDSPDCAIDLPRFCFPEPVRPMPSQHAGIDTVVPQIDAARVMAYVFTSGSSGTPLPHRKTWGFLVKSARAEAARLGLLDARPYTLVGTVPPQHMFGFESTVLLALLGGIAFSNQQPFYPADIRAALEAVPQPRVLVTSPIHLRALLLTEHAVPAVPATALVLSSTAPLSDKLAAQVEAQFGAPLMEIYGSTETGQIASRRTARTAAWELLSEVSLETRPAAGDDENGPAVWALGGHVEVPVPLGDALELLDDTHFLLHGRRADLINIAGKRTSLAYLNHQLNAIPGVVDGVFFMPDDSVAAGHPEHGQRHTHEPVKRLIALVVAPGLTRAGLRRALRERIDAAFMPRPLLLVDSLPRNATGKLPRDMLAQAVAQHLHGTVKTHHPSTDVKSALTFTICADHPALPGHFPGQPIVPGVVLLDHAISAIGAALNRSFDACRLDLAKFPSPAAPGVPLDVAFDITASGAVRFIVSSGAQTVASGVLAPPSGLARVSSSA